jgi:ABC-type multidrug transport system fused ATPase/permease subunit
MRKLISWITTKLKDVVGEEHWDDPVWSKVISAGIITAISIIFSVCGLVLIYLYSLIIKVPVREVLLILGQKTEIPNWMLAVFLLFFVSWTVNFGYFVYKRRQKTLTGRQSMVNYDVDISNKFPVIEATQKKSFNQVLKVVEASYGTSNKSLDVTTILNQLINNNRLEFVANNDLVGEDPDFGTVKNLKITYKIDDLEKTENYIEGEKVTIPM